MGVANKAKSEITRQKIQDFHQVFLFIMREVGTSLVVQWLIPPSKAEGTGLIPWSAGSPGEGNGNPLQ